jgi:serine/threonine-protein kinase
MELVEGGTLRELLRERGPMPPHAVAAVLAPVLSGLAVAHHAGLVHRDVKPENVLISDEGDVKIADFGLVRAVAEAKITSTSVILGTAAYLSPEQVSTGDASSRSDVYAVGILTYELLTGDTPFNADSALAVAYQRMDNDVPAPSAAIAGVPPQFDELVASATARNPADRFADAAEMVAELEAIGEELNLPPFRVPAPRNSAQHHAAEVFHSQVVEERTTAVTSATRPAPAEAHPRVHPRGTAARKPIRATAIRAFRRDRAQRVRVGQTTRQAGAAAVGADRPDPDRIGGCRGVDARQQPRGPAVVPPRVATLLPADR